MSQFIEMFGDPMTNTKAWVEFGYIGNYTQIVLGATPNSKNLSYWNGEIKWITPAEMTEESYYIYDTERHLTEEGLKAANLTLLPCRSVLFSTRAPIGKVGLVGSPMYCNQGFKNFVCGNQLNPVYLYYLLIFKREYLVSLGTGTTFKELSKKAVENLKIAVPPLILQNRFEEIYQQADKSKFGDFKSQFIEMFGTVESYCKLDDLVSDTFPGEWGCEPTSENAIKVIRTTNFTNEGHLDLADIVTRDIESKKVARKKLKQGDTILERSGGTKDNPVGRVVFFDEIGDYLPNNFTQVLRPKEFVNPVYLFYALYNSYNINKAAMRAMASQTTGIQNLSMSDFMAKSIVLPSRDEQNKFEQIYRQADKSKSVIQKALVYLNDIQSDELGKIA